MDVLPTQVDPSSEAYRANEVGHAALGEDLRRLLDSVRLGGSEKAREKHAARGKLHVRQRIDGLLDPDSPFLEFSALAAHELYPKPAPAAGVVTGIGRIHGREVLVVANDATVKGAAISP